MRQLGRDDKVSGFNYGCYTKYNKAKMRLFCLPSIT